VFGILVMASSCKRSQKRLSNAKILLMHMSGLVIAQSVTAYFLVYLQVEILIKTRLFTFWVVFLVLQRLTIVILSIDQIAIIKLELNYKLVMTRTKLLVMTLLSYLIGIELAVLRFTWLDYSRRAYIATTANVLAVDTAFIVMAFTTFFQLKLWRSRRRRGRKGSDAFKATLFILSVQIVLSVVPDVIGIATDFRKKHNNLWQSITQVTVGASAMLDPLLYIALIKTNRRTARRMLKKIRPKNKVDIVSSHQNYPNSSTR